MFGFLNNDFLCHVREEKYEIPNKAYKTVLKASNRNDDPARIRWINSDLIGFTNKMKNIKAEI